MRRRIHATRQGPKPPSRRAPLGRAANASAIRCPLADALRAPTNPTDLVDSSGKSPSTESTGGGSGSNASSGGYSASPKNTMRPPSLANARTSFSAAAAETTSMEIRPPALANAGNAANASAAEA